MIDCDDSAALPSIPKAREPLRVLTYTSRNEIPLPLNQVSSFCEKAYLLDHEYMNFCSDIFGQFQLLSEYLRLVEHISAHPVRLHHIHIALRFDNKFPIILAWKGKAVRS
jgi:hypothetical protein